MISTRSGPILLQSVRRQIRQHEMFLGGERVLLAVSGGVDSIVMLDVIARIAPLLKLSLAVAHFDHGLRGEESKKDAEFVVEAAKSRGLRTYVGRGDAARLAEAGKISVEDAARRVRYQFLSRVAKKMDFQMVLTAHNANDNAETLVMNLLRGTGVSGLAGIPPMRTLTDGTILARPLLDTERSSIEEYANETSLTWREDETNAQKKFTRNRIRHELLPMLATYNPSIIGTLNSTTEIMRGVEHYMSHAVDLATKKVVGNTTDEEVELNIVHLKHYLPAIQSELIQRVVSRTFDVPAISYGAVERVLGLIWKESGSKAEIGGGLSAVRDRETMTIRCDPPPQLPFERPFTIGDTLQTDRFQLSTGFIDRDRIRFTRNSGIEFVDADKIPEKLLLRNWRDGDKFHPLGMNGEKKVSDFLIDQKVPLDRKREVFVIADGETIIWICGMRLDDRYRVTGSTKRAVRFEVRKGS